MRVGYARVSDWRDLMRWAADLSARTVVIDVEPLVAFWDTSQEHLDQGVAAVLAQVAAIPPVEVVCFATNSARRLSGTPSGAGVRVIYLPSARKPLNTAPYRNLPRPGIVIGDQPATDGVLARRLGYTFLHYSPLLASVPAGPRLLQRCGQWLLPLLFGNQRRP